jgi:hypothetical protein
MTRQPPDIEATKAFNAKIAEEFRANNGNVSAFEGNELLLFADIVPKIIAVAPHFAEFEANTSRVIPIFELDRV